MLHSQKSLLIINILELINEAYTAAFRIIRHLKTVLVEDKPAPTHSQGQALRVPLKKFFLSIDLSGKNFFVENLDTSHPTACLVA